MQNNELNSNQVAALAEGVRTAIEQGVEQVEVIKTRVLEMKDEAVSRGGDALSRIATAIQAHPLKAVAIGFGAGSLLLVGGLFKR